MAAAFFRGGGCFAFLLQGWGSLVWGPDLALRAGGCCYPAQWAEAILPWARSREREAVGVVQFIPGKPLPIACCVSGGSGGGIPLGVELVAEGDARFAAEVRPATLRVALAAGGRGGPCSACRDVGAVCRGCWGGGGEREVKACPLLLCLAGSREGVAPPPYLPGVLPGPPCRPAATVRVSRVESSWGAWSPSWRVRTEREAPAGQKRSGAAAVPSGLFPLPSLLGPGEEPPSPCNYRARAGGGGGLSQSSRGAREGHGPRRRRAARPPGRAQPPVTEGCLCLISRTRGTVRATFGAASRKAGASPAAPFARSIPAVWKWEGRTAPILPRQDSYPWGGGGLSKAAGQPGRGTHRPKQETRPRNPRLPRERGGKLALGKLRAADLHPSDRDAGESVGRSLSGGLRQARPPADTTRDWPCTGSAQLASRDFLRLRSGPDGGPPREGRRSAHAPGLLRQLGGAARSPKTGTALLPGTGAQPFPLRPFLPFLIIPAGQLRSSAPRAAASRTRRSLRRQGWQGTSGPGRETSSSSMQPGEPDENDALQAQVAAGQPCPFPMVVYEPRPLHSQAPLFLKGVPIVARVESTERYTWGSKVRPSTVYALQLSHGQFTWSMKKLFRHFQELHRDLMKHRLLLSLLPLPRFVLQGSWPVGNSLELPPLPHGGSEVSRRPSSKQKQLESYLNTLLEMSAYRDYHAMAEFLDVSRLSFLPDLGPKGLEGMILKRSGGHRIQGLNCFGHHQVCYRWSKRWLVVKDAFLLYLKPESGVISCVLLFDPAFRVQVGKKPTETKYGVRVDNSCRSLVLKCSSYRQARWWGQQITELAASKGHQHLQLHRHEGFVPVREGTPARWFLNGAGYFAAVADALLQARQEIFITDWWLSPEVYMKRPAQSDEWRLDLILKHKAEQGVRVCVLLFKEVGLALGLNSGYSKRALMLLHPNIKVMRHPDHVSSIVFLWAHHEKLVVVDQSVAFLGGLDLAYGRWDTPEYRLTDLEGENGHGAKGGGAPAGEEAPIDLATNQLLWLGKDYGNLIAKDWVHLDKPFEDFIDRFQTPRMPWRDVGVAVHGVAARDVAKHFIQRWNFTKTIKAKYKGSEYPYLLPKSPHVPPKVSYLVPGAQVADVQVLRSVDRWSAGLHECSIYNAYLDVIRSSQHYLYIENQFFISCTDGRSVLNTVGDAVVQRILLAHSEKKPFRVYVLLPLLPGFEGDIAQGGSNSIQAILHFTYRTLCRGESSIVSRLQTVMGEAWRNYVSFCGLRTHGELQGTLLTELVYVHSKMLIADDQRVIIGSANINDRSLLGKRDSELAVLVEDRELVPSVMGGQEYAAGKFALSLRLECFRCLLGVAPEDDVSIRDPISDGFFHDVWCARALANTSIYEEVFRCLPTDAVRSHRALRGHVAVGSLASLSPGRARERLQALRGLLVGFPLEFLAEEHLLPPLNCKEGMIPTEVWT